MLLHSWHKRQSSDSATASVPCKVVYVQPVTKEANGLVDIRGALYVNDLVCVLGMQEGEHLVSGEQVVADTCSLLLGSLLDGHAIEHGQRVHLPLFGPKAPLTVLSLYLSSEESGSQGQRVQAGWTHFRACPAGLLADTVQQPKHATDTSPWPSSPLEWEARCVQHVPGEALPIHGVPGREDIVRQAIAVAWGHMSAPWSFSSSQHAPTGPLAPAGILFTGAPGSGKSTVALAVARALGRPVYRVTSSGLFSSVAGGSERRLSALISQATQNAPCAIILEDLHVLMPSSIKGRSELSRRISRLLYTAMDECALNHVPILWLAAVQELAMIDVSALGPHRMQHVVHLAPLTPEQREKAVFPLLAPTFSHLNEPGLMDSLCKFAASRTHGFSPADLSALAAEVQRLTSSSASGAVARQEQAEQMVLESLLKVRPSIALHAIGSLPRPTDLSKLLPIPVHGSLQGALSILQSSVLLPLQHPSLYASLGSRPPAGVLVHGPSGTGKTTLAHAIAHYARTTGLAQALVVTGPDVISALVGSSEAALSAVYARARELSPCILILDQFEALAPSRAYSKAAKAASSSALANDRLLSVLLTEMDGVQSPVSTRSKAVVHTLYTSTDAQVHPTPLTLSAALSQLAFPAAASQQQSHGVASGSVPTVITIAITRDVSLLDPSVVRPGRLDVHIQTALPSEQQRRAAFGAFFAPAIQAAGASPSTSTTHIPSVLPPPASEPAPLGAQHGPHLPATERNSMDWNKVLEWLASDEVSGGWSYADCEGCVHNAASRALRRWHAKHAGSASLPSLSTAAPVIAALDVLEAAKDIAVLLVNP